MRVDDTGSPWNSSLEGTQPGRAGGVLDWDGEADADEHALLGGIEQARDDADHFALQGHERPARIARIHRRVELDEIGENALAFFRAVLAPQSRDHARRSR